MECFIQSWNALPSTADWLQLDTPWTINASKLQKLDLLSNMVKPVQCNKVEQDTTIDLSAFASFSSSSTLDLAFLSCSQK